ncbi:hypothetical protein [Bacillus licheniformis]|uniref:hypothetical protein n=1 Tax=Bacillus licheniformis TaxID=1402 RepID=UPI001009AA17|nr:hypothetical protein [Bacillus licheniformis]QAW36561.1 hypothetical protein ETK49_04640 [Bacillus licheniformis]TWK69369.1 hypothetical protein CHCC20342_2502 [Bacillus licheniformis]UNJ90535.1 hypothetical protein MN092_06310 [Bacillus licheniformis]
MSEIIKPVITKEQADALLGLYVEEWSEEDVLEYHVTREWTDQFSPLNDLDTMTIAAALINGYEVEKTPEEKVREFYQRYDCDSRMYPAEMYFRAKEIQRIIKCTLNYLGVQVAGINDEMGDENADDR